ncbi:MAG: hypothetical protein K2Z81_06455, partial [Cyanobacteria bacterium]|nr:hypothetical protein [Cyanobacteriota bacterium]
MADTRNPTRTEPYEDYEDYSPDTTSRDASVPMISEVMETLSASARSSSPSGGAGREAAGDLRVLIETAVGSADEHLPPMTISFGPDSDGRLPGVTSPAVRARGGLPPVVPGSDGRLPGVVSTADSARIGVAIPPVVTGSDGRLPGVTSTTDGARISGALPPAGRLLLDSLTAAGHLGKTLYGAARPEDSPLLPWETVAGSLTALAEPGGDLTETVARATKAVKSILEESGKGNPYARAVLEALTGADPTKATSVTTDAARGAGPRPPLDLSKLPRELADEIKRLAVDWKIQDIVNAGGELTETQAKAIKALLGSAADAPGATVTPDGRAGDPSVSDGGGVAGGTDAKVVTRDATGVTIRSSKGTAHVGEDGSWVASDKDGTVKACRDARGVVRSVERDPKTPERLTEVKIGETTWKRSTEKGKETEWVSSDGRKLTGEFTLDKNGTLTIRDDARKLETCFNRDGSVVLRTSDTHQVRRTMDATGGTTDLVHTDKGELVGMRMPDGSTYKKMPKDPKGPADQPDRWLKDGTTEPVAEKRSVAPDGTITIEPQKGEKRVISPGGWETTRINDKTVRTRHMDGGYIRQDESGKTVEIKDKAGYRRSFEYDGEGKMDRLTYANGDKWKRTAGTDEWVLEGSKPPRKWTGKVELTAGGDIVETSTKDGVKHERRIRFDGADVTKENERVTSVTPRGREKVNLSEPGPDGQPRKLSFGDNPKHYWATKDGNNWAEYDSDGKETGRKDQFKLTVDREGNLEKRRTDGKEPACETISTDGTVRVRRADGQLISEEKHDKTKTTATFDKAGKLTGTVEQKPDGKTTIKRDAEGRVVAIDGDYKCAWERDEKGDVVAMEVGGKRYERPKGQRDIYVNTKNPSDILVARIGVSDDGTMKCLHPDGSETRHSTDGSVITSKPDGSMLKHDKNGLTLETTDVKGVKTRYEYTDKPDVLGRPGPRILSTTYGDGKPWTTEDGFEWTNGEKTWHGFVSVDHETGAHTERSCYFKSFERNLDGTERTLPEPDLDARLAHILKRNGECWFQSTKDKEFGAVLKTLEPEQIYFMSHRFNSKDPGALMEHLVKSVGGWDYFRGERIGGHFKRNGSPGEIAAIALRVNEAELRAGWFFRDRKFDDIRRDSLATLGSVSEEGRVQIDQAMRRMYNGKGLTDYCKGLTGKDFYEQALKEFAERGKDVRTNEKMKELFDLAVSSPSRLDDLMVLLGEDVATSKHRTYIREHGGAAAIRDAFTFREPVRTSRDVYMAGLPTSTTKVDQDAIDQATDYLDHGKLTAPTKVKKAIGPFGISEGEVKSALESMSPEHQAMYWDGKRLADSSKSLATMTKPEQEAFRFYDRLNTAIRGLHWWGSDRKAAGYEATIGR